MAKVGLTFVLLTIVAIIIGGISAQKFCSLKSCTAPFIKGKHTLCAYPTSTYANGCGDRSAVKEGLSSGEKADILDTHNKLRAFVANGREMKGNPGPQPRALNLRSLSWDEELATIAQRWANQCRSGHDQCRDVDRFEVGQNIGSRSLSNTFMKNMSDIIVNQWYPEVKNFNKNYVKSLPLINANIYHYTQLVWADTTKVGCGAIRYKKGGWYNTNLICNYGPAGNVDGAPVYKTGYLKLLKSL